jgi:replicative DNA helicase
MSNTIILLKNLIDNPSYLKKVCCHLKAEYFSDRSEREIFKIIDEYHSKYSNAPTLEVVQAELNKKTTLSQDDFERGQQLINEFAREVKQPDLGWLVNETEQFCLSQSVANAISSAIEIMGGEGKQPLTAIPDLMREALNISFDTNVGHDYASDYERRHAKLREQKERMEFDLRWLNLVFGGGLMRKTLNFFLGGPGSGKSLALVHTGAQFYKAGYNVLYVTLELAEERIGERIDANLFDASVADVYEMGLDQYKKRINIVTSMNKGARFFIREYPPASITAAHIRSLLDELESKKDFVPDILIVDYMNLMNSSRYKASSGANSYTILKSVAEELRGIAVEKDLACWTATQANRGALGASDMEMSNVSESLGTVMTADTMIAIIRSEELDQMGQCIFKCLKTRFSDLTNHRAVIGIEEAKMKLTNVDAPGFVTQTTSKHNQQAAPASNSFEEKFGGVNAPRRTGTGGISV